MKRYKLAFLVLLIFSLALFLSGCSSTTPTNQSPDARFSANPTSGEAPLEVSFDASNSSDPDGSIISYDWDFGDGSTGSGVTVTHTYESEGSYSVELTVTDNEGSSDSTTGIIEVSSDSSGIDVTIDTDAKVEILNYELKKDWSDDIKLEGSIKNTSSQEIDIKVEIKAFDTNNVRLDKSLDLLFDLSSGVTTIFEIYTNASYDKVDHIEIWAGEW